MRRPVGVVLWVSVAFLALPSRAGEGSAKGEQRRFCLEEPVTRPVSLPPAVLALLRRDERVGQCLKERGGAAGDLGKWFAASAVDLNADGRPDLVVKAEEACLWGANVGPYWVFRNQPQGYELALQAHALCLEVLPARARGYRHLRTAAATAVSQITVAYTWDGRRYRAGKRQVKALR